MTKKRTTIPAHIERAVMVKSRTACCICFRRGHQIHHIDGDPSNNDLDNLILLCFDHHEQASSKQTLAKNLKQDALKELRDNWWAKVEADLTPTFTIPITNDISTNSLRMLISDVMTCLEIRKLRSTFTNSDWDSTNEFVARLGAFQDFAGYEARKMVLIELEDIAAQCRYRMPATTAYVLASTARDHLPGFPAAEGRNELEREADSQLFEIGLQIVDALIYDGAVKLNNLGIVETGAELLWQITSRARAADNQKALVFAEGVYKHLGQLQARKFTSAWELTDTFYRHAFVEAHRYPELPDHLLDAIANNP